MESNAITKLHNQIAAVCPIDGVSVGRKNDRATWRIDFRPEATDAQRAAAEAIKAGFDFAVEEQRERDARAAADARVEELKAKPAISNRELVELLTLRGVI